MKNVSSKLLALLLVFLAAGGVNCVLEETVIELVVTGSTCLTFDHNETDEVFTKELALDYADEIDKILEDNGMKRSDVDNIGVVSANYTVESVTGTTDWVVSGEITIEETYGPVSHGPLTLIEYESVHLQDVIGVRTVADLTAEGVGLLSSALSMAYLASPHEVPVITLRVESGTGDVDPDPSPSTPLIFTYTVCIVIDVFVRQRYDVLQIF